MSDLPTLRDFEKMCEGVVDLLKSPPAKSVVFTGEGGVGKNIVFNGIAKSIAAQGKALKNAAHMPDKMPVIDGGPDEIDLSRDRLLQEQDEKKAMEIFDNGLPYDINAVRILFRKKSP